MSRVSSLAMLALYPATKLRDRGPPIWVETTRRPYWYRRNVGSDTPKGSERIAASGGGLFYADPTFADSSWLRQAAFTVDSSGGNDDDPTTVKTWWELHQRIGTGNSSQQATTITVPHGLPVGDPMIVDFGNTDTAVFPTAKTTIIGPKGHTGVTGTVGTARRRNIVSQNDPNGILPTGGAFNWSPHIATDRVIVGTGGAIIGKSAHVALAEVSGVGRLSSFLSVDFVEAAITAGDTYELQTLQRVDSVVLRPSLGRVIVQGFVFTKPHEFVSRNSDTTAGAFFECSFEEAPVFTTGGSVQNYINCRHDGHDIDTGGTQIADYLGGIFSSLGSPGGIIAHNTVAGFYSGIIVQDCSIEASLGCPLLDFGDVGIFGSQPVTIDRGSLLNIKSVWGSLSSASAFSLDRTAKVVISPTGIHSLVGTDANRVFSISSPASSVTGDGVSWAQAIAGAYQIDGTEASVSPR